MIIKLFNTLIQKAGSCVGKKSDAEHSMLSNRLNRKRLNNLSPKLNERFAYLFVNQKCLRFIQIKHDFNKACSKNFIFSQHGCFRLTDEVAFHVIF
ncbi:hypothetical protein D3C78_1355160 [compost metagenome]